MTIDYKLNEDRIKDGLTQSELAMMDDCVMKWNLWYNNLVTKRGSWAWPLEVGTAFHCFAESFYNSTKHKGGKPCDPNLVIMEVPDEDVLQDDQFKYDMDYWVAVLGALQRAYVRYWQDDLVAWKPDIVEEVVMKEYRGYKFTGKIDLGGETPKGYGLLDHKSTSSLEKLTEEGWDFRLQFNFYPWLLAETKHPKVFLINGIRKPALRITKSETQLAFINRIARDIASKPTEYFRRTPMPINPERIAHFQRTVLDPKIDFIELAKKNPRLLLNLNTNACTKFNQTCAFLQICRTQLAGNEFQFHQREDKHVELITGPLEVKVTK